MSDGKQFARASLWQSPEDNDKRSRGANGANGWETWFCEDLLASEMF